MANCTVCGSEIPKGRIEALAKMNRKTDRCVEHADVDRYTGHIVITGKTGDEVEVIQDPELARHLDALDKSKRFAPKDKEI